MRECGDFSFGADSGSSAEILRALSAAVGSFFFFQAAQIGLIKDGRSDEGGKNRRTIQMSKLFTYGDDNVDELLATTLSTWVSENLEDEVFGVMPLYKKLYGKAKSKDGGASLLLPVMYAKNDTAQSYSGYDVLNTTPQDGFTNTQATWKSMAVSVSIDGDTLRKNSGKEKVIAILDAKTKQAIESLRDLVSSNLFKAAPGAKDMRSLPILIDATSTIQDVNSTNASWWQATVTTGGSFVTQGLDDMRTTNDTVDEYNPQSIVDIIVTTKAVKNYYEGSLTPGIRYTPRGEGDPTFKGLMFRGAEVFSDPNATSGVMYMFSTDDLYMILNSNGDFKSTEFVKPANQDAKTAQIILMGEMVTRARRKLSKISSITA